MKIIALVENRTDASLKVAHGLALYIETEKHKLMFDLGPDETLFENAEKMGVDLLAVDIVIISHGHKDHGGALKRFMEMNDKAVFYIQKRAFAHHVSRPKENMEINISIDDTLMKDPRIRLLEGDFKIDDELELFTAKSTERCYSYINGCLYEDDKKDEFKHEQNLLIHGDKNVLILGCGHSGLANILDSLSDKNIEYCVGGFHLTNPDTKERVSDELLGELAKEIRGFSDTRFYTCHCTGLEAYEILKNQAPNLNYISCGDVLEI